MLEELKKEVCEANSALGASGLVIYSWGNVSGIDRGEGVMAIKPSGVAYKDLTAEKIVLVDMSGKVVEGEMRPSSDTPTHLELYRNFESIGGICHTHSRYATAWAQARRGIPCLGTTHADYFYGEVPVTGELSAEMIEGDYELNTGKVIVKAFSDGGIDAGQVPGVLVAGHGPFTWGSSAAKSVESAIVLEYVAKMGVDTAIVSGGAKRLEGISKVLLDKHYLRKHGKDAYYGQ
jgi:L-ribulose-5-phosphate 4-epimerase